MSFIVITNGEPHDAIACVAHEGRSRRHLTLLRVRGAVQGSDGLEASGSARLRRRTRPDSRAGARYGLSAPFGLLPAKVLHALEGLVALTLLNGEVLVAALVFVALLSAAEGLPFTLLIEASLFHALAIEVLAVEPLLLLLPCEGLLLLGLLLLLLPVQVLLLLLAVHLLLLLLTVQVLLLLLTVQVLLLLLSVVVVVCGSDGSDQRSEEEERSGGHSGCTCRKLRAPTPDNRSAASTGRDAQSRQQRTPPLSALPIALPSY
ncbi:MAG: hypothetical protein ABTQ32_03225 [Myxococcaceae bacterium]